MAARRDWTDRFRAPRWSLPSWARDAADRCAVGGDPGGTYELFTWTPGTRPVQATRRANGTLHGQLTPDGTRLWWFADADGDEFGTWRRQPFGAGPGSDEPAAPGVPPAYPAGLVLGADGSAVVGGSDDGGTTLWRCRPEAEPTVLYRHREDADVQASTVDGSLIVIGHSERGDNRHPALRALRQDSSVVSDLDDGPGLGLYGVDFLGDSADLLVVHERRGRRELLVWSPLTGAVRELTIDLPGELSADPTPDGAALLVESDHRGRSTLHRYDLATGELTGLPSPRGMLEGVTSRPDGSVWYAWSSAASPPVVRDLDGAEVLPPAGEPTAPDSVDVEDVEAIGSGGLVPAFLRRPREGSAPYATVFLVHGGPTYHDSDSFGPRAAAWVDAGYAVVTVNYRGSTGYGSAWRDAIEASPGHVELADVAAVRARLVESGVADPARCVLTGGSWGGFLTLLGLGTQPELWAAGSAAVPVADYIAAYEDEMEGLKAFDRSLFGGSPTTAPVAYEKASPLTYVEQVRAPLLVLAGANDPRCPIRQIENYLAALAGLGTAYEVYRFDAGHGSLVADERIRQMAAELDFVRRHVPATPPPP